MISFENKLLFCIWKHEKWNCELKLHVNDVNEHVNNVNEHVNNVNEHVNNVNIYSNSSQRHVNLTINIQIERNGVSQVMRTVYPTHPNE